VRSRCYGDEHVEERATLRVWIRMALKAHKFCRGRCQRPVFIVGKLTPLKGGLSIGEQLPYSQNWSGQFLRVREKRRCTAGVPEQNGFAALEPAFTNQIHQCAECAPRINRIEKDSFASRHQSNSLAL
jgi:hypothetical protein